MDQLKQDIRDIKEHLYTYDGSNGKTRADALTYEVERLSKAIDDYVERKLSKKAGKLTNADVASTGLVASTYPVAPGGPPTPVYLDIIDKPV